MNADNDLKLGVSQEYERYKYDNVGKRIKFKNEIFGSKKVVLDHYSGKTIHRSRLAALKKYGKIKHTEHIPDTDHIVPLKMIHKRLRRNPFLTDDNVREVANLKQNYRITSGRFNRSKADKSNWTVAFDQTKDANLTSRTKMIVDDVKARSAIHSITAVRTSQNISNEFKAGAKGSIEASVIPLAVMGVQNLVMMAKGEKKLEEAIKETSIAVATTATTGGMMRVTTSALTNTLNQSSVKAIQTVGNSNIVAQIISVSLLIKDSLIAYMNGEIDSKQFMEQIGEKGVGMVSGIQGAIIGQMLIPIPGVGAIIGSMVLSTVCTELYRFSNKMRAAYESLGEYSELEDKINFIANSALKEMETQRNNLKECISEEFKVWDRKINTAFNIMINATLNNDVNGISASLDDILGIFGERVHFKNYNEFDEFFMNQDAILRL
ncbi:hypothetical protein HGO21_08360 [Acinetobacter sp. CUI P1]|nr:hypothetical protein [Acinetobacter sp. CUI P1]